MSDIRKELETATGVERSKSEDEQEYLKRIVRKVSKLDEKEWDGLSKAAQDWFNDAAECMNDRKDLPSIGGDEDDKPAPRRRVARDEAEAPEVAEPKVGDTVVVTMNDGEKFQGELTEIDEKNVVIDCDGEEEIMRRAKIKDIRVKKAAASGKAKDEDDKPKAREPKVGDQVEVTKADGEIVTGELLELDEKNVVVQVGKEEEIMRRAKVESIKVVEGKAKPATKEEDEKPATRRRASAGADEGGDAKRTRASRGADGGESDVSKAWKVMAEMMPDSPKFEDCAKSVKKAGLDVKDNTLELKFRDLSKAYAYFKELGFIKR